MVQRKPAKVKLLMPHESVDSQESIEMDEYSDEDDEVFVRHNRHNGDNSDARRPLMKKKKKNKQNGDTHTTIRTSNPKYRRCCGPICWTFLVFKSLIGILAITIILVNYFTHTGWYLWRWGDSSVQEFAPCHDIEVIPVWQVKFPKLGSEGNLRLVNITKDDALDLVFGFGTGADGYNVPNFVCDIYFNGQTPCFGGVVALDGKTGKTLWTRWATHEIFAITCQGDLNGDDTDDCVAGGRAGVFFAISGKDGKLLWEFSNHIVQSDLMSVYVAQFVHDLNGDGRPEILAVHGGDELSDPALEEKMFGRLMLFDGRNGTVLRWMQTPDRRESYYPPQILTWLDGEQFVVFGTGGNSRSGSLYVISLVDLYKRNVSMAMPIYTDESKGMLTPAALADINGDDIEDIIIATFNSHVIAFDGRTFKQIWNTSFAGSESYSTIGVGFYDADDTPDFIVKYQFGRGFPVYEYEQTVVLCGKNGSKISKTLADSIGSQSSPLTVSAKGKGNDIYLHWMSNCKGHDKEQLHYTFPDGEPMHDQMRADVCHALFGSRQEATLLALQRFNESNEIVIYNSLYWDSFEHANATNTSAMADRYLSQNPTQEDVYNNETPDNKYSMVPYMKDNFDDVYAQLEKDLAVDPNRVAFAEAEELPETVENPPDDEGKQTKNQEEMIPNQMVYAQPHNVRKYPTELAGQNFENPYGNQMQAGGMYPQQPIMQQQPMQQQYPLPAMMGGNYPMPRQPQYPYPLPNSGYGGRRKRSRRVKRQAGDGHFGLHRIMSTGTLAPSLLAPKYNDTIDLIFTTHWIYPSRTPVIQPEDEKCINDAINRRNDLDSLSDEDMAVLTAEIVEKCMEQSGHLPNKDSVYETPSDYNPFAVNMGQLTVYRFTLKCKCNEDKLLDNENGQQRCGQILPYQEQGWPAFMGIRGDARFNLKSLLHRQSSEQKGGNR